MRIVAMLPVKNESWALENCLSSLSFCDDILAIDDGSTDNTREILEKYGCTIIPYDGKSVVGWKEYEIRSFLLEKAREIRATHLVAIDGDEMFSDTFVEKAKELLAILKPGESVSLPWVNIRRKDTVMKPQFSKPFIMAEDTSLVFEKGFIHIPRVPTKNVAVELKEPYAVLHFQYMNIVRNDYKKIWYMMSELLKGKKGALKINATYLVTKTLREEKRDTSNLTLKDLPNPDLDLGIWQKEAVSKLISEYGCEHFERLDIWYVNELGRMFKERVGRDPRPYKIPEIFIHLFNLRNKINFYLAQRKQ